MWRITSGQGFMPGANFRPISDFPVSPPNEFPQSEKCKARTAFVRWVQPLFWAKTVSHYGGSSALFGPNVKQDASCGASAHGPQMRAFRRLIREFFRWANL
jgi:hypothetical protein